LAYVNMFPDTLATLELSSVARQPLYFFGRNVLWYMFVYWHRVKQEEIRVKASQYHLDDW
jgi:hypothetical protein